MSNIDTSVPSAFHQPRVPLRLLPNGLSLACFLGMISSLLSAAFYYCVAFGVNLPGPLAGIVAAYALAFLIILFPDLISLPRGYQFYGFFPSMKALAKGIAATSQYVCITCLSRINFNEIQFLFKICWWRPPSSKNHLGSRRTQ